MFITQFIFIWMRTLNVRYVATGRVWPAILSGAVIHWTWLIGIAIGVASMAEIVRNFSIEYVPVVAASTLAGAWGTWLALRRATAKK